MWTYDSTAVADTLKEAAGSQDTGWIMHHVLDARELDLTPFGIIHLPQIHLFGMDISITKHVVFMWIAVLLLVLAFIAARKSYQKSLVPRGVTNLLEVLIVFVRDEIAKQTIGHGFEKFLPYLLTVFFFILTCNFLGLIPYGSTATSNISVTATLATISFMVIQIGGIMKNGF
ncbi:MAG: F0F1 ATP synthase subunit A, partial [Ignavibacteria bacterium]|nr:F0F1 ATP synthase subunit A [Ignavibacteria bacterium]